MEDNNRVVNVCLSSFVQFKIYMGFTPMHVWGAKGWGNIN